MFDVSLRHKDTGSYLLPSFPQKCIWDLRVLLRDLGPTGPNLSVETGVSDTPEPVQ